jgi:hypothetical protein
MQLNRLLILGKSGLKIFQIIKKMELKEFIQKSLTEIIDGVIEAQIYAKEKGAKINPSNIVPGTAKYLDGDGFIGQDIEFDVAVIVNESTEGKISAGINVWGIGAGGQKSKEQENSTNSRLKFSIPLFLPIQKK